MTYTINHNTEFNSIEIYFDSKPEQEIRDAMKALKMRWHSVKKCWYGRIEESVARLALGESVATETTATAQAPAAPQVERSHGVQVGDLFVMSWGYEQTNDTFFQVVALRGSQSALIREVRPRVVSDNPTCSMASDRTYAVTRELLPACRNSVFIRDHERGDTKRIMLNRNGEPSFSFNVGSAHPYHGEKLYESWYA